MDAIVQVCHVHIAMSIIMQGGLHIQIARLGAVIVGNLNINMKISVVGIMLLQCASAHANEL